MRDNPSDWREDAAEDSRDVFLGCRVASIIHLGLAMGMEIVELRHVRGS